ncbi:hypothetical protein [Crateriforma conspicua]|uniref:hypothetical protein n=1 Tax=Crateriforma TaxID=2714592 RepID=UPI0011B4F155|nr:hypothetical protein [Crateriforma conspicua]
MATIINDKKRKISRLEERLEELQQSRKMARTPIEHSRISSAEERLRSEKKSIESGLIAPLLELMGEPLRPLPKVDQNCGNIL